MNTKMQKILIIGFCIVACAMAASSSRRKASHQHSSQSLVDESKSVSSAFNKDGTKALIQVAKALARSHSTSEVLTLNLTNLLILIVLKAVIFGIGLFYFGGVSFKGHGGGHGWSEKRSLETKKSSFMSEGEMMLMLTYLLGSANEDYQCMYRVACEDPSKAKSYLNVSKMMLKGAKMAKKFITYNTKYENVIYGLQEAVDFSGMGGDCSKRYTCSDVPSL